MNVLITGAAGFIGSNLVHYLLEKRPTWKLTVLDSLTYAGNLENIGAPLAEKRISFSKTDIVDAAALSEVFSKTAFDLVFHLAAESHVDRSILNPSAFVATNVLGTQNLVSAARASKVKRFIHISTDEVYGSLGPTGKFHETTPLDPTSPYAASKASSDLMVLAAAKTHHFDAVVTRCTNNYGQFQFPEKFIPLFITNAMDNKSLPVYGDGMQIRSWLHVRDHCEALLLVAEKGRAGEAYNIGGDDAAEIPNLHVAKQILSLLGKPESLLTKVADRPAHDRRYAIDFSKINKELGWKPRVDFATGLKETLSWYQQNRAWWERIKSGEYQKFYQANYGNRK